MANTQQKLINRVYRATFSKAAIINNKKESKMFERGLKYETTVTMITETCCSCGISFGFPSDLKIALKADTDKWFYCPNGHSQHYTKSTAQQVREEKEKEIDVLKNRLETLSMSYTTSRIELKNAENKLKRIHSGTCDCCKRTFQNLKTHIERQHPELVGKEKYIHPKKK